MKHKATYEGRSLVGKLPIALKLIEKQFNPKRV